MPNIVIFGAGNIGRAFIGQIFSKGGYEVVFVDIQKDVISELNQRRSYPVLIRQHGKSDETLTVSPVRAVSALDKDVVIKEIQEADILATSVGMNALPHISPLIAEGLLERYRKSLGAIDLILAENIHNGRELLLTELRNYLPADLDIRNELGVVQTSIGKMVPIVTDKDRAEDSLIVVSEPYNELIVDAKGFLNPVPNIPEINAVHPIEAYVDRKLYIHNLGHAATAYLGFQIVPEEKLIADVLENKEILTQVRLTMKESAAALLKMYPGVLEEDTIYGHIEDLLNRFQNRALGDTVFRVGRDLSRKMNREDRIVGSIRNCESFSLPWVHIREVFFAAFGFYAVDDSGNPSLSDTGFLTQLNSSDDSFVELCGLHMTDPVDTRIIRKILNSTRKESLAEAKS